MVVVVVVVRDAVNRSVSVAVTVAFVLVTVTSLVVGVIIQEHAERTSKWRNFLRTRKSETGNSAECGERGWYSREHRFLRALRDHGELIQ